MDTKICTRFFKLFSRYGNNSMPRKMKTACFFYMVLMLVGFICWSKQAPSNSEIVLILAFVVLNMLVCIGFNMSYSVWCSVDFCYKCSWIALFMRSQYPLQTRTKGYLPVHVASDIPFLSSESWATDTRICSLPQSHACVFNSRTTFESIVVLISMNPKCFQVISTWLYYFNLYICQVINLIIRWHNFKIMSIINYYY